MNTPVWDFLRIYAESKNVRLHVPGHKGKTFPRFLSAEYDLTETDGADCLYSAKGIIKESEINAGKVFGADTFYSCEGSTLALKAMVYLAKKYSEIKSERIIAGRNAHKSFIYLAATLGLNVEWLFGENSYLSCPITPKEMERAIVGAKEKPFAAMITSPDYLGNVADISSLSKVCEKYGIPLLVDNAHGAYLKFLQRSAHPIDLGATMCCDSAHKTLPCITAGAYLHISKKAKKEYRENAEEALSFFGSTSPSYLTLANLDTLNPYLCGDFKKELAVTVKRVKKLKNALIYAGYKTVGDELLKITLSPKTYGYTGDELAEILLSKGVYTEFHDNDFLVMTFSVNNSEKDFEKVKSELLSVEKKEEIISRPPKFFIPKKAMEIRDAALKSAERIKTEDAEGRIISSPCAACPPAVSPVVCGEYIDKFAIEVLKYYNIEYLSAVKDNGE